VIKAKGPLPDDRLIYQCIEKELSEELTPAYLKLLKKLQSGEGLHRSDKYRLKMKILSILYPEAKKSEE